MKITYYMCGKLLAFLLLAPQLLTAQSFFTEKTGTPFIGVFNGSVTFSDVNGDGYNDVLITGDTSSETPTSKLYINDGMGTFTEKTGTPFDGVWLGDVAFTDVNNDGHNDVLITGVNSSANFTTKLYINDGTGAFSEVADTPFDGVAGSAIAFADVNGDGYEDVLITGQNASPDQIAKLYTNDGTGTFTEVPDTPFDGVRRGAVAFSDINGDGYNDVLITGENSFSNRIAKLYTNDGAGTFTEMENTPFDGVFYSSVAFSDVNGDGHSDVLITGNTMSYKPIAKLYTNDGAGTFTEITDTPFEGVWASSVAFSDVNGDGHNDVLITGRNIGEQRTSQLYINDGTGIFTKVADTPFDNVYSGAIAFSDINSDGRNDVLITGWASSGTYIAKLYTNNEASSSKDFHLEIGLGVTLSPNPSAASTLLLNCNLTEKREVTIKIYDTNGTLLLQQKEYAIAGQQAFQIDVSTLSNGSYFLELDNGKRRGVVKFVVQ